MGFAHSLCVLFFFSCSLSRVSFLSVLFLCSFSSLVLSLSSFHQGAAQLATDLESLFTVFNAVGVHVPPVATQLAKMLSLSSSQLASFSFDSSSSSTSTKDEDKKIVESVIALRKPQQQTTATSTTTAKK
jgi:hypothetical protein